MSPQFVDFDADGHLDIVAGTFAGSPFLARGSAAGFTAPVQILDAKGERILVNQFWNYDTKQWDETDRCNPDGVQLARGHCTSAYAFDWDADGDLDLLLGDYDGGHLYLRRNDGTKGEHAFASRNEPVLAGGEPIKLDKIATPRMVDHDGDGRLDLLVGTFGDAHGGGHGGRVLLYHNRCPLGAPEFGAPQVLVTAGAKDADRPLRPDTGLYADLADFDGDGDLDLVVGGYSHWKPAQRELSAEEEARVDELRAGLEKVQGEQAALIAGMEEAVKGLDREAANAKRTRFFAERQADFQAIGKRRADLQKQLDGLVAAPKRTSFVWLYEHTGGKAAVQTARRRDV
jgi:hypothetical protein